MSKEHLEFTWRFLVLELLLFIAAVSAPREQYDHIKEARRQIDTFKDQAKAYLEADHAQTR